MKKVIALILVICTVFAFCSCGKPADSGKIKVTMIAPQYGTKTADWWAKFEKDFEASNTNIDLVVDVVSWNDISTVVNTRIANDEAPDLLNSNVFADYQADNLLLPAKTWVSSKTYEKIYPAFLEQSSVKGEVWAIPSLASTRALYYNTDILNAAGVKVPTTWEELTVACKAIKAKNPDIYPWGIDLTTDEGHAAFAYYSWSNGGGFVDDSNNWTLNRAENVAAVDYEIGLVNQGLTNAKPATETRYDLQDLFCAGKLAMMIAPNHLSGLASKAGIHYAISDIPTNIGTPVSIGVMDRIMCFNNKHSDAKLAAITKVIDAFYEDKSYTDWVLMEGYFPVTATAGETVANTNPEMATWINLLKNVKFYPDTKAEWANVKQGIIKAEQEALLGGNVRELLDKLQAQIVH